MGYTFESKGTFNEQLHREAMFKKGVKDGVSFNNFQRRMMDQKLSYKRLDMLKDWNRARAIEPAWRQGARSRAMIWYDDIAMPKMKKSGLTPTEFMGWASRGKTIPFTTVEEQDEWEDYYDEIEDEFEERYEKWG